jgi:hypothetical protein|eukprot:SAG25_NODE_207_length_11874_cov_27.396773_18_plen_74_part_00
MVQLSLLAWHVPAAAMTSHRADLNDIFHAYKTKDEAEALVKVGAAAVSKHTSCYSVVHYQSTRAGCCTAGIAR